MLSVRGKLQLRRKRPVEVAEMDMTPMIDCVTLLLIFFLVTSRMKAHAPLDLPKARHGGAVVEKEAVILTVALGPDGAPHVYRGTGRDRASEIVGLSLAVQEDAIAQYVEQQASANPPKSKVLIRAEGGLKQRDVDRVQRAAGRADVQQLYIAVIEVR